MADAALGAVFGELLRVVIQQASQITNFKTLLERLEATLTRIKPIIERIRELGRVLDHSEQETASFTQHLNKGTELVRRCSKIGRWNAYAKLTHAKKLIRLDNDLQRFFQIEVQAILVSNSMRALIGIQELADDARRHSADFNQFPLPGLPERIIGFDRHLANLKRMLLMDDSQVLVVSAPGGCGKTTLAKMLCHDHRIKDVFGVNILYVIVSRGSNLRTIAKKLFEYHGKSREFETDEAAKNEIEIMLQRQIGSYNRLLLVLDDVWDGSEDIVQDLKFPIAGYKILVTSRCLLQRFNNTYQLSLLNDEDAKTLFNFHAFPSQISKNVPDDLVNKVVESCKGLPLALTVVGASLCGQPVVKWKTTLKKWSEGQSILQSNRRLLDSLQTSIDALDDLPIVKECFLDFGSFPEDDRIEGSVLEDIWVELYNLDNEGLFASENLLELASRNLVSIVPIRKYVGEGEGEGYCNDYYITQHDLLRDLAIDLSGQEPTAQRKRLFLEIHGNSFPTWWNEQTINAHILSISTDESFSSNWLNLDAPKVEVLKLNIRSKEYTLPSFIHRMSGLKVLIITGYGDYPVQLQNLQFIKSLSSLRRIRFEHVSFSTSIQFIFSLQSLRKLSFVACQISDGLNSDSTNNGSPYMQPNLTSLEIDHCYDLQELPAWICILVGLEKLIITNCQELDALPQGLGNLSNLKILRLHCCTKLKELPESIGSLKDVSLVDISDCLSIRVLPEQIGELNGLRVVNMSGCQGLGDLPVSLNRLKQLEDVICDEEISHLWRNVVSDLNLRNLKIHLVEEDRSATFMKICL